MNLLNKNNCNTNINIELAVHVGWRISLMGQLVDCTDSRLIRGESTAAPILPSKMKCHHETGQQAHPSFINVLRGQFYVILNFKQKMLEEMLIATPEYIFKKARFAMVNTILVNTRAERS